MRLTRVDRSAEKRILTGMITSTTFLQRIHPLYDKELFATDAGRIISNWVIEYFRRYHKAPEHAIQGIYEDESRHLAPEVMDSMKEVLLSIAEEYDISNYNEEFLFDQAIQYFKRRQLEVGVKKMQECLERDEIDEADEVRRNIGHIPETFDLGFDPFDPVTVSKLFEYESMTRTKMTFGIPSLDDLTGVMKSGWLVLFMGPMKRGKTNALVYTASRAFNLGLNVIFISLESTGQDIANRFWMNVGALSTTSAKLIFPDFVDKKKQLVGSHSEKRPLVTPATVQRCVIKPLRKQQRKARLGNIRVQSFPSFSSGIDDIENYLESLYAYNEFTPHVICIDYVGALGAPKQYQGRDRYDYITQRMKGLAETYKAIVFSATQGTRKTLEQSVAKETHSMRGSDVPEDIRMLANVDIMLGLNQTEDEKELGIMRVNVLAHRFRRFLNKAQSRILQQPEAGQFVLDDSKFDASKKIIRSNIAEPGTTKRRKKKEMSDEKKIND